LPTAAQTFLVLRTAAAAAAEFALLNLSQRISALPEEKMFSNEQLHLMVMQSRARDLAAKENESSVPGLHENSLRHVERVLGISARPVTFEERSEWLTNVVRVARAMMLEEEPTAEGDEDVESLAALAFDLGVRSADVYVGRSVLEAIARLRKEPTGSATAVINEEDVRYQRMVTDARELALASLDRFDASALSRTSVSPFVARRAARLRAAVAPESSIGFLNAAWHELAVALNHSPEPAPPDLPAPSEKEADVLARILLGRGAADTMNREEFAELAEKRGDPRGAFVREQTRLRTERRRRGSTVAFEHARHREQLERHGATWSAGVRRLGATAVSFGGGFVEEITISVDALVRNLGELLRIAPLRSVVISSGSLATLVASCPSIARIPVIKLPGLGLVDDDMAALTASPYLRYLFALDLSQNHIGRAGLERLAEADNLPRLSFIDLSGNPASPLQTEIAGRYPARAWLRTSCLPALDVLDETSTP